jgi:hypothetical protein
MEIACHLLIKWLDSTIVTETTDLSLEELAKMRMGK